MILKRFKSVVVRLGASLLALVVMVSAQVAAQTPRIVTADDLSRLPLTEMPAQPDTGNTVAIFLTGDGGWATLDKQVVSEMRAHGIAVVGLNTRPYLSKKVSIPGSMRTEEHGPSCRSSRWTRP